MARRGYVVYEFALAVIKPTVSRPAGTPVQKRAVMARGASATTVVPASR